MIQWKKVSHEYNVYTVLYMGDKKVFVLLFSKSLS